MIIGNFTYNEAQDTFTGELATLEVGARKVSFRPNEPRTEKAPHYRVVTLSKSGDVEFGAARKRSSEEGREYLSVKLDDPALTQPLNCALVEPSDGEGFSLVWSRGRRKAKAK